MAKPSVWFVDGIRKISRDDGRSVLNNGKHSVAALKAIAGEEDFDLDELAGLDWRVGDLVATFSQGLYVDHVEYPKDDKDAQVAMQVFAHELEQNKFRPSSMSDKVQITLNMHKRSPGGEWSVVGSTWPQQIINSVSLGLSCSGFRLVRADLYQLQAETVGADVRGRQ